jgi:hypothetical protein
MGDVAPASCRLSREPALSLPKGHPALAGPDLLKSKVRGPRSEARPYASRASGTGSADSRLFCPRAINGSRISTISPP